MSIALMSAVWRLDLPTTEKMVLLALADAANDDGVTWMALESQEGVKLDLIKKTSLSRRAVQGALKRLVESGYLSRVDRPGKGVIWTVKGCTSCAPQEMRPAGDAPGGAAGAPKPSINPQPTSEANASSVAARASKRRERFVPDSWSPNEGHIAKAREFGRDLDAEVEAFRQHEFRDPKSDFDRAFHRWLRNAGAFSSVKPPGATASAAPPALMSAALIARRKALLNDPETSPHC